MQKSCQKAVVNDRHVALSHTRRRRSAVAIVFQLENIINVPQNAINNNLGKAHAA